MSAVSRVTLFDGPRTCTVCGKRSQRPQYCVAGRIYYCSQRCLDKRNNTRRTRWEAGKERTV